MLESEKKLIESLREVGKEIKYGVVEIQITYSREQLKKILIIEKQKIVLLD